MINSAELKDLKKVDIESCDKDQLIDINNVKVDRSGTLEQRLDSFLTQIKNPYLFKVGDIAVKVEFGSNKSLEDSLTTLLSAE